MNSPIKRRVIIGAAGLAVAAGGGGIAIAATGNDRDAERQAYLDNAAKRLNVAPDKLEGALEGAFSDRLDQAVKDKKLTQEQADKIKQRVQKDGLPVPGVGPGGRGPGHGPGGFGGPGFGGPMGAVFREGLETAAKYLGVTTDALRTQLRDGKSLADVAKAQSKDVDGLKKELTDFAKAKLAEAVKDKKLTQEQADRFGQDIDKRVADIVDGKGPMGGPGHGGPKDHARGKMRGGPRFAPPGP